MLAGAIAAGLAFCTLVVIVVVGHSDLDRALRERSSLLDTSRAGS
jgi:hypothetical protein